MQIVEQHERLTRVDIMARGWTIRMIHRFLGRSDGEEISYINRRSYWVLVYLTWRVECAESLEEFEDYCIRMARRYRRAARESKAATYDALVKRSRTTRVYLAQRAAQAGQERFWQAWVDEYRRWLEDVRTEKRVSCFRWSTREGDNRHCIGHYYPLPDGSVFLAGSDYESYYMHIPAGQTAYADLWVKWPRFEPGGLAWFAIRGQEELIPGGRVEEWLIREHWRRHGGTSILNRYGALDATRCRALMAARYYYSQEIRDAIKTT